MTHRHLQDATRIARNTIGLLLVSLVAKGSGLIVVIVVARYLGAETLGVFVVIMALTLLLATVSPLGTPDAAIRAISRDHSTLLRHWVESAAVSVLFALLFGLILVSGSRLMAMPTDAQAAVDIAAVALLPGALMLASQAPLQALERMKYLTVSAFAGRIVGLTLLVLMLESGAGIVAAFVSHLVFLVITDVILAIAIVRHGRTIGASTDWNLTPAGIVRAIVGGLPFAGQRVLGEAVIRITLIVLPLLVTVEAVGLFDAADRIRRTIAIAAPIIMLAVMPEFSRAFTGDMKRATTLAQRTMKFMLIVILPLVFLLVAAAPGIIELLYGAGYDRSVPVLRIGAWSMVFLTADLVLKQIMIANHREHALLWRSCWGVVVQIILMIVLARYFGIKGVALSVVVASAFVLMLDAEFVRRHLTPMNLLTAAVKPLLCAMISGAVALALNEQNLAVTITAAAITYLGAVILFRAITPAEMAILRQLPASLLRKG
ncbi:MAG: flippase [Woeseiaceae bacterium]